MSKRPFPGIHPPIPTPFTASGEIDIEGLSTNLAWWNRHDLAGVVVLGSNGESAHLDDDEKIRLIEHVRSLTPREFFVIAGTGLLSTRATIALNERAAEAGADAALVLPPFFYRGQMHDRALAAHFTAVADASPIPILLYNMPANTGLYLSSDLVVELSAHERIVGLKDSSGDVAKLAEIRGRAPDNFSILAGSAGFLLPALAVGADGGICALANVAPELCTNLYRLACTGDWDAAARIQCRIVRANTAVTRRWGVPALKAALDMIGLRGGPPRAPLVALSEKERAELRKILVEADILTAKETE
jgi:4-hydroxy-2-oxoglutarate aldolase